MKSGKALAALNWLSAGMVAVAVYLVFIVAPMERTMGMGQRIFYFHVGSGWVGAAGFLVALIAGVIALRTGAPEWDRLAASAIEIGLVFITMIIVTGSIWAKATWNHRHLCVHPHAGRHPSDDLWYGCG
jgi:heme exporter protein C